MGLLSRLLRKVAANCWKQRNIPLSWDLIGGRGSMMKSELCRANADQCARLAEEAQHNNHRALCHNMEVCWRVLAVTADLSEDGAGFSALTDAAVLE